MGRKRDELPKQVVTQIRNDRMLLLLIQRGDCEPIRFRTLPISADRFTARFEARGYTVTREAG